MKINEQINFDDITVGDGSQSVKPVTTTNPPKDTKLDEEFMWSFKRLENGLYEIWNLKYAERKHIIL